MQPVLALRFDAPLMSFGGVRVDELNVTEEFPAQSMLAGLCANALGMSHSDVTKVQSLQAHLVQASRIDAPGSKLVDYQTVDLGQDFMHAGWTTRGREEGRLGSASARTGTHQRWRHFWADRVVTICLTLKSGSAVSLDELRRALTYPARPLFLGRKCCLPAAPVFFEALDAEHVLAGLQQLPLSARAQSTCRAMARWPAALGDLPKAQMKRITDERDWANQVHVGRRRVYEGAIEIVGCEEESA